MLRSGLIAVGALCVILGIAAIVSGVFHASLVFVVWGVVLVAGIVLERYRYKLIAQTPPGAGWQRTDERFEDPETGQSVTVYLQPETGERRYVAE